MHFIQVLAMPTADKCYVKHGWIGGVWPIIMKVYSTMLLRLTRVSNFQKKKVLNEI